MFYIIRWKQDHSKVIGFIQDENECAIPFETEDEAREFIDEHIIEPLLEIIKI